MVREAQDRETGRTWLYVDGGGGRTDLAEVTRSAMGTRDDRGDFRAGLASDGAVERGRIGFRRTTGFCRSTTRGRPSSHGQMMMARSPA